MASELDGIEVFVALAEVKGFRAAGERLGVSGSAVSQALRRLEERLGVALVQRTTRSVHLTEAGEQLYAAVRPALEEVRSAVAAVGELGDEPRGTVRLHVSTAADAVLADEILPSAHAACPRTSGSASWSVGVPSPSPAAQPRRPSPSPAVDAAATPAEGTPAPASAGRTCRHSRGKRFGRYAGSPDLPFR